LLSRKKNISLILLLTSAFVATGQNTMYTQTNVQRIFLNPALTGSSTFDNAEAGKISLNTRAQWIKLGKRFVNQSVSFESPVSENASIGFSGAISDYLSGTSNERRYSFFNSNLYYSYSIRINSNTRLMSGLSVGYSNTSFGSNQFNWEDQVNLRNTAFSLATSETTSLLTRDYLNSAAGLALVGKKFYISASAQNLNNPVIGFFDDNLQLPLLINAGIGFEIFENQFKGKWITEFLGYLQEDQSTVRGMLHYKWDNFRTGAGLNFSQFRNENGFNSMSVYFGVRKNNMYVAYSNDINISIKHAGIPMTHELSLVIFPYLLNYTSKPNPFPEY
jgi:type IX secretion system PorP/SprF family membrane protein